MNVNPDQIANNTLAIIAAFGKVIAALSGIIGPMISLIWLAINQWQTNALKSQLAQQATTTDKRLDDHSASIKTLLLNTVPAAASPVVVTPPAAPDSGPVPGTVQATTATVTETAVAPTTPQTPPVPQVPVNPS